VSGQAHQDERSVGSAADNRTEHPVLSVGSGANIGTYALVALDAPIAG
jgi:hypothetical protein